MGKGKKKHSKKDTVSEDILDAATLSVKKFRKVTNEIGKLSVGQKLLGGLALAAAGLLYLAVQDSNEEKADVASSTDDTLRLSEGKGAASANDEQEEDAADKSVSAPRKSRKSSKSGK